jgi:protein SHQ1
MLTPKFKLEQDNDHVTVKMHCPYIKAQDVEISLSGTEFRFYCHPYFLRLHFPHCLIENGNEKSSYDIDSGWVTLKLPKQVPGQEFKDLDLLTKLLDMKQPSKSVEPKGPLIQIMEQESTVKMQDDDEDDTEEFDWHFEQKLVPEEEIVTGCLYGFNNLYQGCGSNVHELAKEILDINDLDSSTPTSRRNDRLLREELKFDDDYYMWDFAMNKEIPKLIEFRPLSWKALGRVQKSKDNLQQDIFFTFNEQEQEQLQKLVNKKHFIDNEMKPKLYLGLVDILFAYCYNHRTTEGEDTVESAWTICKLSGTLSSFDTFHSVLDVIQCCIRRSLIYPLYRSFELAQKVVQDVVVLLKLGKRAILKALIQIKTLFSVHDYMYLMDRIYITDYCVWIQSASDKQFKSLASELHHMEIPKSITGWDLEMLEEAAFKLKQEEEQQSI